MTTISQLEGRIVELERDILYYKNRYERIRNERDDMKNKFNDLMNNSEKIDKATSLYLKELSEKGEVDGLACKMFNVLEGNIK
ncbi:MAG: hypothetical protein II625_07045 [Bacilli bacterium]|nr:hypothetical protein [Bacilli bacterium]